MKNVPLFLVYLVSNEGISGALQGPLTQQNNGPTTSPHLIDVSVAMTNWVLDPPSSCPW